jgi:hypothetical protein
MFLNFAGPKYGYFYFRYGYFMVTLWLLYFRAPVWLLYGYFMLTLWCRHSFVVLRVLMCALSRTLRSLLAFVRGLSRALVCLVVYASLAPCVPSWSFACAGVPCRVGAARSGRRVAPSCRLAPMSYMPNVVLFLVLVAGPPVVFEVPRHGARCGWSSSLAPPGVLEVPRLGSC